MNQNSTIRTNNVCTNDKQVINVTVVKMSKGIESENLYHERNTNRLPTRDGTDDSFYFIYPHTEEVCDKVRSWSFLTATPYFLVLDQLNGKLVMHESDVKSLQGIIDEFLIKVNLNSDDFIQLVAYTVKDQVSTVAHTPSTFVNVFRLFNSVIYNTNTDEYYSDLNAKGIYKALPRYNNDIDNLGYSMCNINIDDIIPFDTSKPIFEDRSISSNNQHTNPEVIYFQVKRVQPTTKSSVIEKLFNYFKKK
jgi:hypothetical protein